MKKIIYDLLEKHYGYKVLKEEQLKIIEMILDKKDCIGILPTGYGKSITFQIPALIFEGLTLVITPLIALMQDQVQALKKKNISAEYINSLQSLQQQNDIYQKILENKVKILYVSGERLFNKEFQEIVFKMKVSLIVCDEAHTLLWSEDFRVALGHIPEFINKLEEKPILLALTATATKSTINKITSLLELNKPQIISINCDRKNIFYRIISSKDKLKDLYKYLVKNKVEFGIIYCLTIKNCLKVYNFLFNQKFKVGLYYGPMEAEQKLKSQMDFINHNFQFIICTNAFGMGIDIPDIRYVILYDMPLCIEDFVQQTGRASRDGGYGEAVLFFNVEDIRIARYFIDNLENKEKSYLELKQIKKDKYNKLESMVGFCLTNKCLHQYINKYFNQESFGNCQMCSNCKKSFYLR